MEMECPGQISVESNTEAFYPISRSLAVQYDDDSFHYFVKKCYVFEIVLPIVLELILFNVNIIVFQHFC